MAYEASKHCIYLKDGKFDGASTAGTIMDAFVASGQSTMVVHFHGGLVTRDAGEAAAQYLFDNSYGDVAFPVFFIWESGIREMLRQALPDVLRNETFKILQEYVSRFAVGKINQSEQAQALAGLDGTRGDGGSLVPIDAIDANDELRDAQDTGRAAFSNKNPDVVDEQETLSTAEEERFIQELEKDARLQQQAAAIAEQIAPAPRAANGSAEATRGAVNTAGSGGSATYDLLAPEVQEEIKTKVVEQTGQPAEGEASRGPLTAAALGTLGWRGGRILKNVVWRFARKRHHGIHATIVEEILRELFIGRAGIQLWTTMKNDTADAFGGDPQIHGGTAFLRALGQLHQQDKAPKRLVLVGHSTGAVYICHLLKHAHEVLPDTKFDIIFLAPACDFRLLADTLDDFKGQIEHFRFYSMKDEYERAEFLLELEELKNYPRLQKAYPGSLLYFVSGVLEDEADKPIVGMQRFYSGQAPYDAERYPEIRRVFNYLEGIPNSRIWSKTEEGAVAGLTSDAVSHGSFDDSKLTLASLKHLLSNGF